MRRRVIFLTTPKIWEPETIELMNAIYVSYNSTIYGTAPFDLTGIELWEFTNEFFVDTKNVFGLPLGIKNLKSKIQCLWLHLLDSASTCKFNASDAADTNAAHRKTFSGGWTFNGAGVKGNGTNAYANTYWDSLSKAGTQQIMYGGYQRAKGTTGLEGAWDLNNPTRIYEFGLFDGFTIGNQSSSGNNKLGVTVVNLTPSQMRTYDKDGIALTYSAPTLTLTSIPVYHGGRNNNNSSINQYNDIEWAIQFLTGESITEAQILNWTPIINNYMVNLKRNV